MRVWCVGLSLPASLLSTTTRSKFTNTSFSFKPKPRRRFRLYLSTTRPFIFISQFANHPNSDNNNYSNYWNFGEGNGAVAAAAEASSNDDEEFVVVNFYHFVGIKDPQREVAKHLSFFKWLLPRVLVQWAGLPLEDSTWEDFSQFKLAFPHFYLEDKVFFEGESIAMHDPVAENDEQEAGKEEQEKKGLRPRRQKKQSTRLKDYKLD